MAKIFPELKDFTNIPYAEKLVYEFLKNLGDEFTVFYSVQWCNSYRKWNTTWKENDFLILHKKRGILVLEIKGGDIQIENGEFCQINTFTKEKRILRFDKDPLSQAIDGTHHYRGLLDRIQKNLSKRFPVEAAVGFPSCEVKSQKKNFPDKYQNVFKAVLDYEDFNKKEKEETIYDVFEFYERRREEKVDITDREYRKIVKCIGGDLNLTAVPSARKEELDYVFLQLTQEQMGLLDYISEQKYATIQGIAGTGKTLIAQEAAKRFAAEGRKVLFLCYTLFLNFHLREFSSCENVDYLNLHQLIGQYRPHRQDDLLNNEKRMEVLWNIEWDELDYDDIIIDEGQDFQNEEIEYFKEYAKNKKGSLFIFYDKNQLLMPQEMPEWIEKSECRLVLNKNCRNTKEIANSSYNVIGISLDKKENMVQGPEPTISFVEKDKDPFLEMEKLIRFLMKEYTYKYSDIVILSLHSEEKSFVPKDLEKIGEIPISRKKRSDSAVWFTTAFKFKGLESRAVIIIDIGEEHFADESMKRRFYVGCSRATQYLHLFFYGDKQKKQAIADAINKESNCGVMGRILMRTRTKPLDLDNL